MTAVYHMKYTVKNKFFELTLFLLKDLLYHSSQEFFLGVERDGSEGDKRKVLMYVAGNTFFGCLF